MKISSSVVEKLVNFIDFWLKFQEFQEDWLKSIPAYHQISLPVGAYRRRAIR